MIRFRTTLEKTIQSAAVLVKLENGRVDRLRLLKLLYLADRESLSERGFPIIGGRVSALPHGPIHSAVYDLIKGEHESEEAWSAVFSSDGHSVALRANPGRMELSPYEIAKLTETFDRYRAIDTWDLVEITHALPEWKECHKEGSSATIPMEVLLTHLGFTSEEILDVKNEADSYGKIKRALA